MFRTSILVRLVVMTILIFVVLDLAASWISSPRFGTEDSKFLLGLGAIILGVVSVFVVENMPTAMSRGGLPPDFQPSPTSGLVMISLVVAGIILIVLATTGYWWGTVNKIFLVEPELRF